LTKKANMSIDLIFIISISIVGIFFLLFLFSGKFPALGKEIYCKTFFHLQAARFFPENIRQSQDYCKDEANKGANAILLSVRDFKTIGLYDGATTARISGTSTIRISLPPDAQPVSTNFTFFSREPLTRIAMDAGSDGSYEGSLTTFYGERFSVTSIDLTNAIYRTLNITPKPCPGGKCTLPITITVEGGSAVLVNSEVKYQSCALAETLIAQMVLCDEKSEEGNVKKNIICGEVAVLTNCKPENITEFNAVQKIKSNNLCSKLPKQSFDCGVGDKVSWKISEAKPGQNIIIEYLYRDRQIRVS